MWPNPQFPGDLVTHLLKLSVMENFVFCAVRLFGQIIWSFFWDERLQVLRKIAVREIFCEKKYEKRFCKIPEVFYSFAMKRSPKFFIVLPWKGAHCRCLRGSLAILFRNFFFRAARDVFRILSSIWDGVFYLAL